MAPWNLSTRTITLKNDKILVNSEFELVFFHYSGFDSGANQTVFDYYVPDKSNPIYKLRDEYISEMNSFGQSDYGKYQWTYDTYFDGSKIDKKVRIKYRDTKYYDTIDVNPFSLSNEHLKDMLGITQQYKVDNAGIFRRIVRHIIPFKLRKKLKDFKSGEKNI